jgi:hypothetical protein
MRTIFHSADGRPSGSSLQAVEQAYLKDSNKSETLVCNGGGILKGKASRSNQEWLAFSSLYLKILYFFIRKIRGSLDDIGGNAHRFQITGD